MTNILILGGSSYLGRRLHTMAGPGNSVATYHSNPIEGGRYFDALSMHIAQMLPPGATISHAVILLANTSPDWCAKEPEESWSLNVTATKKVIDDAAALDMVPVFTSTEAVFDGAKGGYVEGDTARPILTYGRQKREVEEYLAQREGRHLIFRLGRLFGSEPDDGSVVPDIVRRIVRGESLRCSGDQLFSPIHVDEAAEGMLRGMRSGANGLFHLCGRTAVSRYEIARVAAEAYRRAGGDYGGTIERASISDFPTMETRPLDVSMSPQRAVAEFGLGLGSLADWIEKLVEKEIRRHATAA